jgi:hypothetical protein
MLTYADVCRHVIISHSLLHLGVGSVIAYSCHVNTLESRNQFAKVKHVKLAARQACLTTYIYIYIYIYIDFFLNIF